MTHCQVALPYLLQPAQWLTSQCQPTQWHDWTTQSSQLRMQNCGMCPMLLVIHIHYEPLSTLANQCQIYYQPSSIMIRCYFNNIKPVIELRLNYDWWLRPQWVLNVVNMFQTYCEPQYTWRYVYLLLLVKFRYLVLLTVVNLLINCCQMMSTSWSVFKPILNHKHPKIYRVTRINQPISIGIVHHHYQQQPNKPNSSMIHIYSHIPLWLVLVLMFYNHTYICINQSIYIYDMYMIYVNIFSYILYKWLSMYMILFYLIYYKCIDSFAIVNSWFLLIRVYVWLY